MLFVAMAILTVVPSHEVSSAEKATYEDCIIESMKGVTSNLAARLIRDACRSKFPDVCSEFALTNDQLKLVRIEPGSRLVVKDEVTGEFRPVWNSPYHKIYNENSKFSLRELTLQIIDSKTGQYYQQRVRLDRPVPAMGYGTFELHPRYDSAWSWLLLSGKACEAQ